MKKRGNRLWRIVCFKQCDDGEIIKEEIMKFAGFIILAVLGIIILVTHPFIFIALHLGLIGLAILIKRAKAEEGSHVLKKG